MAEFQIDGRCPICEGPKRFEASGSWLRDDLLCNTCKSIPRERALAVVLDELRPSWRGLRIHESSPAPRGISAKLARECKGYVASHFFPDGEVGSTIKGFRNENLERMTFPVETFDIVITLDVMEHVNLPRRVFQEVARTLKVGGVYIFTVPTYKGLERTQRRAAYIDGEVEHVTGTPEYHGNPISDAGSLVTFHYGYDLPEHIFSWSGLSTRVYRFHDHYHGILGEFTEVYACFKR